VRVLDFGQTPEGHAFLVMELLRGETLRHRLQRETHLAVNDAASAIADVCAGLAACHAGVVVHRDVNRKMAPSCSSRVQRPCRWIVQASSSLPLVGCTRRLPRLDDDVVEGWVTPASSPRHRSSMTPILALTAAAALATPPPPTASSSSPSVQALSSARVQAEQDHLRRLAIWAGSNVVAGGALLWLATPGLSPLPADQVPTMLQGFSIQSLAWGGINLAICGIGAAFPSTPGDDRVVALAAEDDLGKVLWTNVGLDAGYMFAGGTMIAAGAAGAAPAVDWQSHGAGIVMQGAGLLVLDGIAVWSSGPREEALQALSSSPTSPPTSSSTP